MACVRTCIPCALHKAPLAWFLMAPWDVSKLLLCSRMHPLSRMGCVNAGGREHPLSPLSLLGGCTGSGARGFGLWSRRICHTAHTAGPGCPREERRLEAASSVGPCQLCFLTPVSCCNDPSVGHRQS